jgi:molybdopterin converting factor small subunit
VISNITGRSCINGKGRLSTMKVRVLYFSQVRKAAGTGEEELTVRAGALLRDVVAEAEQRHPALRPYLPSLLVTLNEEWAEKSAPVGEGDTIGLMPPVSGG